MERGDSRHHMAEIHKIPKRTRFNQQRPPLYYAAVDGTRIERLALPHVPSAKAVDRSRTHPRLPESMRPTNTRPTKTQPAKMVPAKSRVEKPTQNPMPLTPVVRTPDPSAENQARPSTYPVPRSSFQSAPASSNRAASSGRQADGGKNRPGSLSPSKQRFTGSALASKRRMTGAEDGPHATPNYPVPGVGRSRRPASLPSTEGAGRAMGGSPLFQFPVEADDEKPSDDRFERHEPPSQPPIEARRPFGSRPGSTPVGNQVSEGLNGRSKDTEKDEARDDPKQVLMESFGSAPNQGVRSTSLGQHDAPGARAGQRSVRLPPLDLSPSTTKSIPARASAQPDSQPEPRFNQARQEILPRLNPSAFDELPSLRDVLTNTGNLPLQAMLLGVCDDQLPVLVDLYDPAPGSLLVIGDERQQALDVLRAALLSVALRNTARGAQFIVFSHRPEGWEQWIDDYDLRRHCLDVVAADSKQALIWIDRLAEWAEQRADNLRDGPPVLVLFDALSFMMRLSDDARKRLTGLIQAGPQGRIWSLGAVSTALASSMNRHLHGFTTWVWGYSEDAAVYTRLVGLSTAEAAGFGAPGQFAVRVGTPGEEIWLKFRVPGIDDL